MKKLVRFVGITVIGICISTSSVSAQGCGNCDGDSDGSVDIADITCLIGYLYLDYPVFGNIEDIDIDDYEGVTSRDLVYLTDFFGGMTFSPFFCPTSNPPLVPLPDSSFMVEYPDIVIRGVSEIELPIYLTISHDLNIVQLPFRLSLGEEIPKIDSIVFSILVGSFNRKDRHGQWRICIILVSCIQFTDYVS